MQAFLNAQIEQLGGGSTTNIQITQTSDLGVVPVNNIYPEGIGPIGASHTPRSLGYVTLDDYIAALPELYRPAVTSWAAVQITLDDECDFIAWQTASNYIYDRDATLNGGSVNWSAGAIGTDGRYIINRTVTFNHVSIGIRGAAPAAHRFATASQSSVRYNGAAGTIDDPVFMFDFYTNDEFDNPPAGRLGNTTINGAHVEIANISFVGSGGNIAVEGSHNYVSAVLLRRTNGAYIHHNSFGGGLYDGVVERGPSLFVTIEQNTFYGCNRDCIASWAQGGQSGGFTTTVWIRGNEFGLHGRYALLLDLTGATQAFPIVRDNSFEGLSGTSFYVTHPEHFVHGVVAPVAYLNCGNLIDNGSRFEGNPSSAHGCIHLVQSPFATIELASLAGIILTTHSAAQRPSDAASAFQTARKYLDITDTRNYRAGSTGDFGSAIGQLNLKRLAGANWIFGLDGSGLSVTGNSIYEDVNFTMWFLPSMDAVAREGKKMTPIATAVPIYDRGVDPARTITFKNSTNRVRRYGFYNRDTETGDYSIVGGPVASDWAATTVYHTTFAASATAKVSRMLIVPTLANWTGFIYQATAGDGGSSGSNEPTWPTSIGGTVVDGGITWTAVDRIFLVAENLVREWVESGIRNRYGTAAPTTGLWARGDRVWNSAPSAAGTEGWVCVTAGLPGTWKTFGVIAA